MLSDIEKENLQLRWMVITMTDKFCKDFGHLQECTVTQRLQVFEGLVNGTQQANHDLSEVLLGMCKHYNIEWDAAWKKFSPKTIGESV